MEPPFLISLIFVQLKANLAKYNFNFYHFNLFNWLIEKRLWKCKFEVMITLNCVKRNNRKKTTYFIVNAVQIPIEFWFFLIFKKDNLIKNDDIAPDWLAIKRDKLWKRRKATEINRRLIFFQTCFRKFNSRQGFGAWVCRTSVYPQTLISKIYKNTFL